KNLNMYDELEEYTKWGSIVTVQIVVTKNDVGALEEKIRRCHDAGVKAVVMCAVHLKNTKDHLPDLWSMSRVGLEMKKKYPGVIISPDGYFDRITWDHGCDTSSIIVDADGFLWYPCRVLEEKTINLIDSDLMTYLESPDGHERRQRMAACDIQCAWYQYYATQSFVNPVPPKRRRILATVLTIVLHLVLAGVLVDAGIRWSVGTLSIVAGLTFLLIFLMIALSYLRNFGSKSVDFVRSGPMGLDRPHVLFVGMTTVGYLVLLLVLGSALGPGTFLWFFFVFWILFAF